MYRLILTTFVVNHYITVGWIICFNSDYLVFISFSLIKAGKDEYKLDNVWLNGDRMIALLSLWLFQHCFWACFEQAGGTHKFIC